MTTTTTPQEKAQATPVHIQHLVGGRWLSGSGDELRSINPTRPSASVAEGRTATTSDVDTAAPSASVSSPSR